MLGAERRRALAGMLGGDVPTRDEVTVYLSIACSEIFFRTGWRGRHRIAALPPHVVP